MIHTSTKRVLQLSMFLVVAVSPGCGKSESESTTESAQAERSPQAQKATEQEAFVGGAVSRAEAGAGRLVQGVGSGVESLAESLDLNLVVVDALEKALKNPEHGDDFKITSQDDASQIALKVFLNTMRKRVASCPNEGIFVSTIYNRRASSSSDPYWSAGSPKGPEELRDGHKVILQGKRIEPIVHRSAFNPTEAQSLNGQRPMLTYTFALKLAPFRVKNIGEGGSEWADSYKIGNVKIRVARVANEEEQKRVPGKLIYTLEEPEYVGLNCGFEPLAREEQPAENAPAGRTTKSVATSKRELTPQEIENVRAARRQRGARILNNPDEYNKELVRDVNRELEALTKSAPMDENLRKELLDTLRKGESQPQKSKKQ